MDLSFDNTEIAFAYKKDKELKNAQFLFKIMNTPWVASAGAYAAPWILKAGLPIKGLIRRTIFKQFVGAETLDGTVPLTKMLHNYNVKAIVDYGVEGKETEEEFDKATEEILRAINHAATQKNIPFVSVKLTALARFPLLHALNQSPRLRSGLHNSEEEIEEWENVKERMYRICAAATEKYVGVLIDAEESWIQDPIDRLAMELMEVFNRERVVVYNTLQLYRHDRLAFLKMSYDISKRGGFKLGVKLVRGAYMEKERSRAFLKMYPSPIQPDKASTDRDYDAALVYCLEHINDIAMIVATHNEHSSLLAAAILESKGLELDHPHVHFSQLYGMSDHITFNLANAGFSVSKYVPYGPLKDVIPYLMRRAQENNSMNGQSGRELSLLKKELKRRKAK